MDKGNGPSGKGAAAGWRMDPSEDFLVDERRWVRKARDGSPQAFECLYRQQVGRIYGLCLRMTAQRELAEDLTQEAFVRAWERLDSFRGESGFGTWLHRIAVNAVLDHVRKVSRRTLWEMDTGAGDTVLECAVCQADPGLRMDLEQAIAGLPDAARLVFVLHDVEGFRHEEIAERAGIAVGTSKAHLHRARRLLRERIGS